MRHDSKAGRYRGICFGTELRPKSAGNRLNRNLVTFLNDVFAILTCLAKVGLGSTSASAECLMAAAVTGMLRTRVTAAPGPDSGASPLEFLEIGFIAVRYKRSAKEAALRSRRAVDP